jgi:hypothetical protein
MKQQFFCFTAGAGIIFITSKTFALLQAQVLFSS